MLLASEPDHFPEDALAPSDEANEFVEAFLAKFLEGEYEFEGTTVDCTKLEGEAVLTHILPALPIIIAPVLDTDDPPVVDPNNLVVEWESVTTRFIGEGPVEIIEYQVIINQEDPAREMPLIDGGTRRGLLNVPASVTSLKVPPELLEPSAEYEIEILAIERSGNSTISVVSFVTE